MKQARLDNFFSGSAKKAKTETQKSAEYTGPKKYSFLL